MRPLIIAVRLAVIVALLTGPVQADEELAPMAEPELPEAKQTSLGLYVTSLEAYRMWEASAGETKILDVRTLEEHIFIGHADMAWNVPLAIQTHDWDAEKQRFSMKSNPDFVAQVKDWAQLDDTILVMCRSGGRSAMAVNALAEAGFTKVYNIVDGMEGDTVDDPESLYHGKRMRNGWKNSGLPWTYQLHPNRIRVPDQQEKSGDS